MLILLQKIEELSNGTLGTKKTDLVEFELREGAKPICSRPYPVPKVHEGIFKNEVEFLLLLGLLERANDSEWGPHTLHNPNQNQINYFF